jgi:ABC-type phosphate transport system substrate-binding protein
VMPMRRLTAFAALLALAIGLRADVGAAPGTILGPAPEQAALLEPLAIVVNRSNPVNGLTSSELHKIFLGDRSHWTPDRRITLVMREPGEAERRTILRDVCGMTEDQFKTHFLHGLFTGEILVSPKILASPTGARKFIYNVPGAIGYLRVSDVDDTVKVLRIDELLPNDRSYKLRVDARQVGK